MASKSPTDQLETFLRYLGQSEETLNNLALKVTASAGFTRGIHTVSALNRTLVQRAQKQRARLIKDLKLISREQFEQLSERVEHLESLVEQLCNSGNGMRVRLPSAKARKRPARTRRPPRGRHPTYGSLLMVAPVVLVKGLGNKVKRALKTGRKGFQTLAAPIPAMGLSPKTLLLQRGTLRLYHYQAVQDEVYRVPVLLVAATSNRATLFDLAPGSSLVEYLLLHGHDVYVLEWNDPRSDEKVLRLEDYVLDFLPDCLHHIQEDSGEPDVNLVGYCMGGLLSVLYAALHPDGPVKHLVCLTTPMDFSEMELFQAWTDRQGFDVDAAVDSLGIMPSSFVRAGFNVLRPLPPVAATARLWGNIRNPEFVQHYRLVTAWANDTLPLPGELFRQLIKDFFWDNKLHAGKLRLGGRPVNLKKIKIPFLHIVAQHDHIVPYACAHPLLQAIGSKEKEEVCLKGGHVSVVAGPHARKRMWPLLDAWLATRAT